MHPLDNVIWQALGTRQAHMGEAAESARRFVPQVSILAALRTPEDEAFDALSQLSQRGDTAAVLLPEPYKDRPGWATIHTAPLLEMVHEGAAQAVTSGNGRPRTIELGDPDIPEMLALTQLTKPGPFSARTRDMGTYLGIRVNGTLAAMAGERLKVPGYTEISAVCTHPNFTGRGYAHVLMNELIWRIYERAEIPFLHVREDNAHAIGIYRKMGFRERVLLHLAVIGKQ